MKILLCGIGARFLHTTLSVHILRQYAAEQYGIRSETAEFTINQHEDFILSELFRLSPDLLGFSCYIWNYGIIRRLIPSLKKILPGIKIFVGGPEVSYQPEEALRETGADYVLSGEGEEPFSRLCLALLNRTGLETVPSLCRLENGVPVRNPAAEPLDLAKLPFAYRDLSQFENRILYYEAQRGCPFGCRYCLSSIEHGVRFQPLDKVKAELQHFLDAKVSQVKFVDRTFNVNESFSMEIWRYPAEHDNGITNFHFELEAELLTEKQLTFLAGMRPGLFQFEIGVQSANPDTLRAVNRQSDLSRLAEIVKKLRQPRNIHLHLDLIAGLPLEDYESFSRSFDTVFRMEPDQLQLGFLKLLKGSGLRQDAAQYGICYRSEPPYEVLCTDVLPFSDLLRLKDMEEQLERYGNSGRFSASVPYLARLCDRPFAFYEQFSAWYRAEGLHLAPHTKLDQYEILYRWGCMLPGCDPEVLGFKMRYDLCSHENCKSLPEWLPTLDSPAHRELRRRFFSNPDHIARYLPEYAGLDPKLIEKTAHLDFFPFHPMLDDGQPCACLFN